MTLDGQVRFARALPTFLENWPLALQALSVAQADIALTVLQARALGSNIRHFGHWFGDEPPPALDDLAQHLQAAMNRFPGGAFVRLGSRSGKDCDYAIASGLRVGSVRAALLMLTDGSRRIASDLRQCIARGYGPHVFVREWLPLPPWAELRCFMRARQLVGISQYDCVNLGPQPELAARADAIHSAVAAFFARFVAAIHIDDVVFDVFLSAAPGGHQVRLLEINPFGPETDAALFRWDAGRGDGDFDGSFRFLR